MRSRTAIWFECKVRYEKTMEDGTIKKVTEVYVVDALSFSEAEKRITEEMSSYVSGELEICNLKIAPYKEIFFEVSDLADKWYKAKLAFITIDEKPTRRRKPRSIISSMPGTSIRLSRISTRLWRVQ